MNEQEFLDKPPFPTYIQFETATTCNAQCLMCPHKTMRRHGVAKWSTLTKIIHEVAQTTETICPFLMQEPFLEPRLTAILSNLKQNNMKIKIHIYSNMSVLSDEQIHQIVELGLIDELHMSFYGPTEELYAKWQPPLDRTKTVENIRRLHAYRNLRHRLKPKMILHIMALPEIMASLDGYKDVTPYVDETFPVWFDTFHGDIPNYAGNYSERLKPANPRVPCERLYNSMMIHFDGSVVPCCIDYNDENIIGNVNKSSLHDIWLNEDFTRFRQLHLERRWDEIPMCRNCIVHEHEFSKDWVAYWIKQK